MIHLFQWNPLHDHLVGRPSESDNQYSTSLERASEAHGGCSGCTSGCIWCYDVKNQGVGGANSRPSGGTTDHTQPGKPTHPSHSFADLLCERIDLFNKKWIFQYFISGRYMYLSPIHLQPCQKGEAICRFCLLHFLYWKPHTLVLSIENIWSS